ncbi:MAG: pseudouridine synthase [Microbacter sp.]
MDSKDNSWQDPDQSSGHDAGRDGNFNKSNRTRQRFMTRNSSDRNYSSKSRDNQSYNTPKRDNDSSTYRSTSRDQQNPYHSQRDNKPYNNNYSQRSDRPYSQQGQKPFNRNNNSYSSSKPYRSSNSSDEENKSFSRNAGGRTSDNRGNNSYERNNNYNSGRRDGPNRPYSGNDRDQHRDGYKPSYRPRQNDYRPTPNPRTYTSLSNPNEPIRLNKFLANAGICSRREADEYIKAGVVTVNGKVITELGTKILPTDKVMFHDQPVQSEKKVYILLNKPKDFVTTTDDPKERKTVLDLVKNACNERIYPVGRLDRSTTGVLLLTNDGDLASRLTHPKYNKKKIYHVFLDKALTRADMEQIVRGIELEDGEIHADEVHYVDEEDHKQVGIEIHSGKNRIVRRIFDHLGYRVKRLDRVFFAGLTKKGLPRGTWRYLTQQEVNMLKMGAFE